MELGSPESWDPDDTYTAKEQKSQVCMPRSHTVGLQYNPVDLQYNTLGAQTLPAPLSLSTSPTTCLP